MSTILLRSLLLSLLIVLIAASSSHRAMAQTAPSGTQRIVHESWTFKDGAPELPTAFAQTADGYLWVGAPAGLFRFDGVRFELFRSPFGDPLQSTNVSTLFAADDRLWVGYVFGGFSFLRNGRVTNFVETTGTVTGFAQDRDGTTWAGARGSVGQGGLWRFEGSSWQQVGAEWNMPAKPVAQLGFDRDGTLWVLTGARGPETQKQLYFLRPGERQFRNAGNNLLVTSFTWDADNKVLTTPARNAKQPDASVELGTSLPAYPILRKQSDQILDRANGIWLMPMESGVLRHSLREPLTESVREAAPSNSEVYELNPRAYARFVDREGSFWVGSDVAVHRFSYSQLIRQELPKWPTPWFVLAPDEGGVVWISAGDGVGRSSLYRVIDGTVDSQRPVAGASSFAYRAPDKTYWLGGEGGLWHMVDSNLTKIDLPHGITRGLVTMTHEPSGGFWVSFGGLGLYRLKEGVWTKFEGKRDASAASARPACPASGVVISFTDSRRRVWLGCTKSQLTVLDADREQTFGPGDGVQVGNVTAIYGKGSEIWIGGEFGLQQFDHGRFHTIRAVDNESLRGISGIVETANGDLWLNGLGGIVHIRRADIVEGLKNPAYQVSVERFDRRAGLPGLPSQLRGMPTAIEGTDGRLWFTVINGVVWLDPTRASNRAAPPPVSIQSVSADDKVYELDQLPKFPAGTSNVQISYAAVNLLNPEAIRFRYKLQEMDNDWEKAARSTSVSYRNLPPGSYHFEVGASDANGSWSDKTATAEFTILPAYYQTHWFRALGACLFLAMLWMAYRLRVRQLQRRFEVTLRAEEKLREKDNALEMTRTELERVSRLTTLGELTTSIAHEVSQPLGGMVASAGACVRWLAANPPAITEARTALDNIVADGKRAREVIGRIRALTKRQAPRTDLLDLNREILEVLELTERELRGHDIVLETKLDSTLPQVKADRVQLQQVLLNLILNAIEAMSAVNDRRRELTVVSAQDTGGVVVEVRDSGIGFDQDRAERVFEAFYTTKPEGLGIGLSISRSIVEAHGGRLRAAPNQPHGAVFGFSLPVAENGQS